MGMHFIDDCEWKINQEPQWDVDFYGLDTCDVLYRGRVDKKASFENSLYPRRFQPFQDGGYNFPRMYLSGWSTNHINDWTPGIILHYRGFKSGNIPPVHQIDGTSCQSAQGEGTDTATSEEVTGSFLYRASRTTYQWFETSDPNGLSRYNLVRKPLNPFNNLISYRMSKKSDGTQVNSIPYSSFVAVMNSLIVRHVVSDFSADDIIPGKLWVCQAEVDFKILS